jgi:hypothetical protein
MCYALGSKGGRQKEKDCMLYLVVDNFVLYYKFCDFSHALLVFFTHMSSFTCKYRLVMPDWL